MNKTQQLASGFVAVLLLGMVAVVPMTGNTGSVHAVASERPGLHLITPLVSVELPQEQVRDMTYN